MPSSIRVPEIATAVGTLDDSAFADGRPVSAHHVRVLAMAANRLLAKGELLHNICGNLSKNATNWNSHDTNTSVGLVGSAFDWYPLTPAFLQPKKPGLTTATAYINASILNSAGTEKISFSVTTSAAPNPGRAYNGNPNYVTMTTQTASAYDNTGSIDGIMLDPGPMERVTYWFRGYPTGQDGDGSAFGSSAAADTGSIWGSTINTITRDNSDTWVSQGSQYGEDTWANYGHYIEIDAPSDATPTGYYRRHNANIVAVLSSNTLEFYPPLLSSRDPAYLLGGQFQIKRLPKFAIGSLALIADARSF